MDLKKILLGISALCLLSCNSSSDSATSEWEKAGSGVWQLSSGHPEKVNLTSELGITPKWDAINRINDAPIPIDLSEVKVSQIDHQTYVRFPLAKDERIFGLGLNFKTVEQRGRILELHVDHYGGQDNGRTHAPVPFFVSDKGYGVLINSARYIKAYVGIGVRKDSKTPAEVKDRNTDADWSAQPYSDNLELLIPAEGVEMTLFTGDNMLDVVRRYNLYNGGGILPPKWGLGFWHRVPALYSDKDVEQEVAEFKSKGFPLSVIGLEPGWMSSSYPCTYEWDSSRFPDPQSFVKDMDQKGIKINVWINPGISPKSEVYDKIEPFTCSHTEWNGIIPDYTLDKASEIMCAHFNKHVLNLGVSGFKMDENDGYDCWLWPDVATFPSGISGEQMRQIYGSMMQKRTTDLFRSKNQRTYGLVRAGNAGTTSYPYVIYNDYYNHRDFITALINSSFIGIMWTPEVRSSRTSEEWLRRMQTACFSPLFMINAWADGTKPWSFADVNPEIKEVSKLRMQLFPYFYTTFADYAFEGIPPVRAMNLEEGYNVQSQLESTNLDATDNPYALAVKKENKDQYIMGKNLLVAPLFAGEQERNVILPKGNWYDFYTGKYVGNGEIIRIKPTDKAIPLFVKDGGIIPMFTQIPDTCNQPLALEIRHYGNKSGKFELYDDDGNTYNYEKGEYARINLEVSVSADGKKTGKCEIKDPEKLWSYDGTYHFKFMTTE